MIACGLDFGTSNSAIGVLHDGAPRLVPGEGDATLLPSAVFFDADRQGGVSFGAAAIAAHAEQAEGRLMRAVKSILGSSLIDDETVLAGRKVPLTRVVEMFVRHLKDRAEAFAGHEITAVVHGRPVRFVDDDDAADARAQAVLDGIARRAGFREVSFVYEPIAAAHHYEASVASEEIALIADIGGGTSDFAVVRLGADRRARVDRAGDVLAATGVRVGGTDFDTALSLAAVMPLLGSRTRLIEKDLPMPKALYRELATWATINFAYTHKNERAVAELAARAREPEKVRRLLDVLRGRLGHRLAFAVEDAKIALSRDERATVALDVIERGLVARASRRGFERAIAPAMERLTASATRCIAAAGAGPRGIDAIFLTGGSSRVPAVGMAIHRAAPQARVVRGDDLLSVALGLTRIAAEGGAFR